MLQHKVTVRVKYADTDAMGIVYNGRYLEYFEVGRTELLRAHGLPYVNVEREGYQLPLLEAFVRYKTPAVYDDLLEIEATVKELYSPRIHIEYVIRRQGTNDVIATGHTEHVFIKKGSLRPVRPPAFYVNALKKFFERD